MDNLEEKDRFLEVSYLPRLNQGETEIMNKVKRQPAEWEKIIANERTDKELFSKIYKQHVTECQKNKQPNQKVGKRPKQTFLRRHTDV